MYGMQVMPETARDPGFGVRPAQNNSPEEFNRVGRDYRAAMQSRYDNDLAKMWAAYNWGPGNLDGAIQRHGPNWMQALPNETREYLRRNLARMRGR